MQPTTFEQANVPFKKPKGWTDEQCGTLDTFMGTVNGGPNDGMPVIISKWIPTPEEIEAIVNGEGIYLEILGSGMPPVSLYTKCPFHIEDNNEG